MKDDASVVARVPGVEEATYYVLKTARIEWGKNDIDYQGVMTYPLDKTQKLALETLTYKIMSGRNLKQGDKYKVVIGYDYANSQSYDKKLRVGDKILVNGAEFQVVGINQKTGSPSDDRVVIMSGYAFDQLFNTGDEVTEIVARVNTGVNPADVVPKIEDDLRRHRDVKKGEEDFEVTTFESLIQTFLTIFNIVGVVLVGIAAISLVVGGIGIMNTMYTAVLERTRDIGIMKAIGARNEDILVLFLIESGFLGLIGGAIGVILGLAFAKAVQFVGTQYLGTELLQAAVPWWLVVGALSFAFILGSVSGILPAKQASSMSPVDALRTE